MKKIHLIEIVKDFLSGGDAPTDVKGRYHDEIISNLASIAHKRIINETYYECKRKGEYSILSSWAMDHTLTITSPPQTSAVLTLPFVPMQIADDKGILQVVSGQDLTYAFAYQANTAEAIFNSLEVCTVSSRATYSTQMALSSGAAIYTLNLKKIPASCTTVLVKMITPLEELDDYDNIAIPEGREQIIIQSVIEMLRQKPKEDNINDNKA